MNKKLEKKLSDFQNKEQIVNVGELGTVLVLTRKTEKLGLPLNADLLLTPGGGQVSGLSGRAINKILQAHGVSSLVGTESGRTSRGTPRLARAYAAFLNELNDESLAKLAEIETWWVARFVDYFNTEPFKLNYDQGKTLNAVLSNLLEQARERQRKSPGKTYVGAVLQHLIGAKLELALPKVKISHNGFSVADSVSDRQGDFAIDEVIIHCTTAPTDALLRKCKSNIDSGRRPIVLTIGKMLSATEVMADDLGLSGRVEIMDAMQFLTANLYEMSLFKAAQRKITLEKLINKYNDLVSENESDASLRIAIG